MTFLIVEDNLNMQNTIHRILERILGNIKKIYFCEDGNEALQLYKQYRPDWVLMDIKLKNLDGLTATKNILMLDPYANVVIVTQYSDEIYQLEAKKAGATGFIQKDNLYQLVDLLDINY